MKKTEMNLDFYSDTLESDISLLISVNYEAVEVTTEECERFGTKTSEESYFEAQFLKEDVTILNTNLNNKVSLEFFSEFEDYENIIADKIETDLN